MKNTLLLLSFIVMLASCSSDDNPKAEHREFRPEDVLVGIKSGTNIYTIFDFINQFDHKVENLGSITFTSDLPSDRLQYVLDVLNEKAYTNNGTDWFVTGYLNYQTNQITIFPRLFGIENLEYQTDWLASMQDLKLKMKHIPEVGSGVIHFKVPIGSELEWKYQFETDYIVDWVELNYVNTAGPDYPGSRDN